MPRSVFVVLCFAILAASAARAETLSPNEYFALRRQAVQLLDRDEDAPAEAALTRLTAAYDRDGALWFDLGECRYRLGKYREGIDAFRRSFALGQWSRAEVAIRIARGFARVGDRDSTLAWLDRGLALAYEGRASLAEDMDFEPLRPDARFRMLAGVAPDPPLERVAGWRYDIDWYLGEIRRLHYLYRVQPLPPGFEAAVRALRERVSSLSDEDVLVELQALASRLGDGHSSVFFTGGRRVQLRQEPVCFHLFADGLFVIDAPDSLESLIGARVERIGDTPTAVALRRLDAIMSHDNSNAVRILGPLFLRFPAVPHHLGLTPRGDELPLALALRDGRSTRVVLGAREVPKPSHPPKLIAPRLAGLGEPPLYLRKVDTFYWFEPMPADSAVYVQFNQVVDMYGETLRDFALRLRRHLDEHREVRHLVVDVRHNNGGNGELTTPLIRTLVHFETTHPGGRIYTITSPMTFSAAQDFVNRLDRLTNTVFVGETSGSRPNMVGEHVEVVLPWSGTTASISSRLHQSSSVDDRVWIPTEMPVASTSVDYFANRDAALEAVLLAIRGAGTRVP